MLTSTLQWTDLQAGTMSMVERGSCLRRTQELGRQHGLLELPLHESHCPLQGLGDIVTHSHECILTVQFSLSMNETTWCELHTHATFSFKSCFSLTAEERSSSSRFEAPVASMARFDARSAALDSFFILWEICKWTRVNHVRVSLPRQRLAVCTHDTPQLPAVLLPMLVIDGNV